MAIPLLLLLSLTASSMAESSYVVLAPTTIRPGMELSVSVHILRATADVNVTASVMLVGTPQTVMSVSKNFVQDSPGNLTMQIPDDLASTSYELKVQATGGLTFSSYQKLTFVDKYLSVFVQTDKAMYNPGQTVNFRTVALYPDMKVYTGNMTVSILDPKGNTIQLWPNVTGENGVFVQALNLSTKPVEGDWKIHVEAETATKEKVFTVAEYVLPKFEVEVDVPTFALETDTTIPVKVTARYTFGTPVNGSIVITPQLVNNPYHTGSCFVFVSRTAELNDQGEASVEFPVSHLSQLMCGYSSSLLSRSIEFDVNVTETATGITLNGSATVKFYRDSARIQFLSISPKTFKPGLDYVAYIKISQPDGLPLTSWAGKTLTVTRTVESWDITCEYRYGYVYTTLDPMTFVIPADGLVTVEQLNLPENALRIMLNAEYNGLGDTLLIERSYSPSNSFIQASVNSSAVLEVGQFAEFKIKATEPMGELVYQVLSRGTVASSGSAPQTRGATEYTLAIPCLPSMASEARLLIYYVRDDGEIVSDAFTFYVEKGFENKVTVTMDRQEAEPGESVQLQISATPLSTAYVLAVDQSSLLLKSGNDITADQVFEEMKAYDVNNGRRSNYSDAVAIFQNAGLAVMSDGGLGSCATTWSSWINNDNPDRGDGDHEQLSPNQWAQICPNGHVDGIECQTVDGVPSENSSEVVSCTLHGGLSCINQDNFPYPCSDYKVRYRCNTCTQTGYNNCVDKISFCASYGEMVCHEYVLWARENCARYCGFCSSSSYLQAIEQNQTGSCADVTDLVFVVDDSSSVTNSDFTMLKTWIEDLLNSVLVAPDKVRVGLMTFETHVEAQFHLNNFTTQYETLGNIRNHMQHHGGGTNTGGALEFLRTTMFTEENGDRAGVPNVAIVITDGQSTFPNYTANQAQLARDDNITLLVLGIGAGVSNSEIEAIATAPASENAFHVSSYHLLSSVLTSFRGALCKAGGYTPRLTNCSSGVHPTGFPPAYTSSSTDNCVDKLPDCEIYTVEACQGPYIPWAQRNCARFCGFCSAYTDSNCVDTIPDCDAYVMPEGCQGQYIPWARQHCARYCGFCSSFIAGFSGSGSSSVGTGISGAVAAFTGTPGTQTGSVGGIGYAHAAYTVAPSATQAPMGIAATSSPAVLDYTQELAEVERVRMQFPETWLWTSASVGANGTAVVTATVPDTITSWVTSAFAVSSSTGFGVTSQATKLRVFRPFFVTLNLPYSVIRGEQVVIQAVVFNYMNTDQQVRVTMAQSQDFFNLEIDSNGQEQLTRHDKATTVDIPAGESKSVYFPIVPIKLGHVELVISAQSHDAADGIRRNLLVEAEGVPMEVNYGMVVDLTNSSTFTRDVPLPLPNNTVTGSERVRVSAIGDLMGPTLAGLDSLLRMPHGCGEQTMIGLAPDVFVLDYLDATNQLTEDIRQRAVSYIESGYQHELSYQHTDGSFSIWGNRDYSGSMWLTAFVAKTFRQARPYATIDDHVIIRALEWMLARQNYDGSFPEPNRVHDTSLQGGATADRLTAFVLISLLENKDVPDASLKYRLNSAVQKAVTYLKQHTPSQNDTYGLAISAYGLTLAGDSHGSTLLTTLESKAITDGENKYWTDRVSSQPHYDYYYNPYRYTAHDIEVTSYALLTYAATRDFVGGRGVMNWLASQRNGYGGFRSTQDTVVALQALSRFTPMAGNSNGLNIDVRAKAPSFNPHFSVSDSNAIVLQTAETETVPDSLEITATGSGVALVQVDLFFNVEQEVEKPTFEIAVNILTDDLNILELETCAKWLASGYSGMAVVEVGVPSGFEADLDTVTGPAALRQTELEDKKAIFYFDVIGRTESCVRMTVQRALMVAKSKPSAVRVYDYYSPENQAKAFYESAVLKDSTACDVCPECQCPRTTHK